MQLSNISARRAVFFLRCVVRAATARRGILLQTQRIARRVGSASDSALYSTIPPFPARRPRTLRRPKCRSGNGTGALDAGLTLLAWKKDKAPSPLGFWASGAEGVQTWDTLFGGEWAGFRQGAALHPPKGMIPFGNLFCCRAWTIRTALPGQNTDPARLRIWRAGSSVFSCVLPETKGRI